MFGQRERLLERQALAAQRSGEPVETELGPTRFERAVTRQSDRQRLALRIALEHEAARARCIQAQGRRGQLARAKTGVAQRQARAPRGSTQDVGKTCRYREAARRDPGRTGAGGELGSACREVDQLPAGRVQSDAELQTAAQWCAGEL